MIFEQKRLPKPWSKAWVSNSLAREGGSETSVAWLGHPSCAILARRCGEPERETSSQQRRKWADRFQAVRSAGDAARLTRVWRHLDESGLHAILIKGWSTARLYPKPGMRAMGDIDLAFASDELPRALRVREDHPLDFAMTDFHEGLPDLPDRTWNEAFGRTRIVPLADCRIRVLGWEDHLRLTCRHLVRHGLRIPMQLCDVATILESLPADFDWSECLRGSSQATQWQLAILGLAQELMGAEIRDRRVAQQAMRVPRWLKEMTPLIWNAGTEPHSLRYYLRRPREAWSALRYRYFNPIRASFKTRMLPRNRLELALMLLCYFAVFRAPSLLTQLASVPLRSIRGRRRPRRSFDVHRQKGRMT